MSVAVCNVIHLPTWMIEHAKAEAADVFRAVDVDIRWTSCGSELREQDPHMRPDFIIRVLAGGHANKGGPASLETMGQAFLGAGGAGYLADAYYGAIREITLLYKSAGGDQVLAFTMAHELGHLLIGPGHGSDGIMRANWSREELDALSRNRLKFNKAQRAAILRNLRSRAAGPDAAPAPGVAVQR